MMDVKKLHLSPSAYSDGTSWVFKTRASIVYDGDTYLVFDNRLFRPAMTGEDGVYIKNNEIAEVGDCFVVVEGNFRFDTARCKKDICKSHSDCYCSNLLHTFEAEKHTLVDGFYYFVGPSVRHDPHGVGHDTFWPHSDPLPDGFSPECTYQGLHDFFDHVPVFGIRWDHKRHGAVQALRQDYGLCWPRVVYQIVYRNK